MSARLDKLERTDSNGSVLIWQNNGETDEAAMTAGAPRVRQLANNVHLIRWEDPQ